MPDLNLQFLTRKNLLHVVRAAVGSEMFRCTFVYDRHTGQEIDTMKNGQLSCANFVSSVLTLLMLIDHPHSTVATTLKKMEEAGWYKIDTPKPGAVVHWPEGKDGHQHLGFYIDEHTFISNYSEKGSPQAHGPERPAGRLPDAYYWHPKLDD